MRLVVPKSSPSCIIAYLHLRGVAYFDSHRNQQSCDDCYELKCCIAVNKIIMKIGYCEGTDEKALSASGSLSPPSSSSAILKEISPFPALLLLARLLSGKQIWHVPRSSSASNGECWTGTQPKYVNKIFDIFTCGVAVRSMDR